MGCPMKRTVAILLTLSLPLFTAAQNKHNLSLDQSIDLSLRQGYAVQNTTSQYLASKKGFESALRKMRTSVALSLDVPSFSESLNNQFNPSTQLYEFYQLRTTRVQSGLTITQPLIFSGGSITFRETLFGREQLSGLSGFSQSGHDYFNNFSVELRQPLLTPNLLQLSSDRASINLEQARSDFMKNQLDVIYNVTESFFSLYQLSQRVEITKEQVKQNEESYQTSKNKFNAGLIPEVEVLQSEVDLVSSQNDLFNAERDLSRTKNGFRLLAGIPTDDDVELVASLSYQPVKIDQARAIQSALENRSEVLNADRNKQLRKMDIDLATSKSDFRLDVTATYGFNRNDQELNNVFHDFGRARSATLTVSVPLFDWGSNSLEVEAAQVLHTNSQATYDFVRQQIRQEIVDLINRIQAAESRIKVLEKVVAVAQKSYDISLSRFQSGTISRNDLAQAQQRLTTAKINNLSALIDYRIGLADLKRRTLYDFEKNEPVRPTFVD